MTISNRSTTHFAALFLTIVLMNTIFVCFVRCDIEQYQKQLRQMKKDLMKKPAKERQVTTPWLRLPWIVDTVMNPIRSWPMFFLYGNWIFTGFLAMCVGWLFPWYEYLKLGYTHYHPGMIWDKEFTEFATWYFKHKIYKKKYWNLDAYLYRYYHANNDNLRNFYEEKTVAVPAGDNEYGYAAGNRVDSGIPALPGAGNNEEDPPLEHVLAGIVQDMVENNPSLAKFVEYMTEGNGFERLKEILEDVIQEEFTGDDKGGSVTDAGHPVLPNGSETSKRES